jgi:dienelactone hydrolase
MIPARFRQLFVVVVASAVLAAACGDDTGSGGRADAGSGGGSDGDVTAEPTSYAGRGPYAVGEIDLELDAEHQVAVLYPVDPDTVGEDAQAYSYSGDTIFGPEISDVLPGALSAAISPEDTWVGLPASEDGPFPIVLHSHGASGNLRFANLHNAQVASWGYTVVVVDHPERGVAAALTSFGGGSDDDERDFSDTFLDTDQLLAGLDLVEAEAASAGSPIEGTVDAEQVAAEGHSAGGSASGAAAYDGRVDLWLGQAPGAPIPPDTDLEAYVVEEEDDDGEVREQIDIEAVRAGADPPDVASMIIAAEGDSVIELGGIESTYDWLASPKRLAVIAESGHAVFVDPCLSVREEGGLSDFVEALGLDPEEVPLIELGENGCLPEEISPEVIWPLIDHLTVAQLEAIFGDEAVGAASLEREYLDEAFPGLLADYRVG